MPLHLIKLSVGARGLDDLRRWQAQHATDHPPLRHRTRHLPRRAADVLDGGSIYWVIDRILAVRQRIVDIRPAVRDDGTNCADLILDPVLVPVQGRFVRPFQGWRYLSATDAPDDIGAAVCHASLPETLLRELTALALM